MNASGRLTWAVIAFLFGNVTGIIGTVATFAGDLREMKVTLREVVRVQQDHEKRLQTAEIRAAESRAAQQAGTVKP